ncbi:2-amino-4-hydroxy-6-hydroxymethyldihydropteridine pyrophosphokinase [Rufibacter sp. DG15C]|uniref:2-amino-4-hydroxy-6- hydroxymethyldihydropteridine diphosphokinase n=1 Tax=Rufibacter sp. DG15C TaxID=1379909 RepID=UPI00078BCAEF|nr:2-amino-4-hydroxy-6-hydroxymethyldihydropteridine diphosphokinase [Rufibacter sp. DG15C]AMM52641.1 2-amino-4-hydroxy-6-hydroxymethyldihydropteridine pyrophosphokinase [Rufibacter sp. DG15C]
MKPLFLLLGSNLGDRVSYLQEAYLQLSAIFGESGQKSSMYETAAWGVEDQPAFLNQALLFHLDLPPLEILAFTQQVEQDLGRERKERWGARVIDIDILLYGNTVLETPTLTIPHPHLHQRRFTLAPLAELAPEFDHPVLGQTIAQLLAVCPDTLPVRLIS